MTRFFLHLNECGDIARDEEGSCYVDAEAAREAATRAAREIMAHEVRAGRLCLSCHIDIVNVEGERVARISFAEALVVSGI